VVLLPQVVLSRFTMRRLLVRQAPPPPRPYTTMLSHVRPCRPVHLRPPSASSMRHGISRQPPGPSRHSAPSDISSNFFWGGGRGGYLVLCPAHDTAAAEEPVREFDTSNSWLVDYELYPADHLTLTVRSLSDFCLLIHTETINQRAPSTSVACV